MSLLLGQSELQGFQQQVNAAVARNLSKTAVLSSYFPYKAPVRATDSGRRTAEWMRIGHIWSSKWLPSAPRMHNVSNVSDVAGMPLRDARPSDHCRHGVRHNAFIWQ